MSRLLGHTVAIAAAACASNLNYLHFKGYPYHFYSVLYIYILFYAKFFRYCWCSYHIGKKVAILIKVKKNKLPNKKKSYLLPIYNLTFKTYSLKNIRVICLPWVPVPLKKILKHKYLAKICMRYCNHWISYTQHYHLEHLYVRLFLR